MSPWRVSFALGFFLACEQGAAVPPRVILAPGAIAQVGSQSIDAEQVASVASARGLDKRLSMEAVSRDALFAEAFKRAHPERARFLLRTVLARHLSEALMAEALAAGAPTKAELRERTAHNWWQMDRPAMTRVTHAVVLLSPDSSSADRGAAKVLAQRLRLALASAKSVDEFRSIAEAFAPDAFELKVEDLDPVAADGRAVDPTAPPPPGAEPQRYSPEVARAASQLLAVGDQSPLVESDFGFHVLRCTERLPALRRSESERRELLREEIVDRRAAKLQDRLLAKARESTAVSLELSAVSATEALQAPR